MMTSCSDLFRALSMLVTESHDDRIPEPRGESMRILAVSARHELDVLRARDATLAKVEEVLRRGGGVRQMHAGGPPLTMAMTTAVDWVGGETLDAALDAALAARGEGA